VNDAEFRRRAHALLRVAVVMEEGASHAASEEHQALLAAGAIDPGGKLAAFDAASVERRIGDRRENVAEHQTIQALLENDGPALAALKELAAGNCLCYVGSALCVACVAKEQLAKIQPPAGGGS
jgi:hypothetical protein